MKINSRVPVCFADRGANAGKSTLMNTLVGQKVSIVTPKVQTTRSRVRGIAMHDGAQVIFIDTPGIFKPKRRLDRAMVSAAWQGASDSDLVVLVHDAARTKIDDDTQRILDNLAKRGAGCAGAEQDRPCGTRTSPRTCR